MWGGGGGCCCFKAAEVAAGCMLVIGHMHTHHTQIDGLNAKLIEAGGALKAKEELKDERCVLRFLLTNHSETLVLGEMADYRIPMCLCKCQCLCMCVCVCVCARAIGWSPEGQGKAHK